MKILERYPPEINHEGWPRLVRRVAKEGGFAVADIDFIIFTQVRKPSIELVMADLGLPMEKTHTIMERVGLHRLGLHPDGARRRPRRRVRSAEGRSGRDVGSGVGYNQAGGRVPDAVRPGPGPRRRDP